MAVDFAELNWLAIVFAMLASIVLGFLWYAPFTPTGKIWMRGMNFPADVKPTRNKMIVAYILMVLGSFLMFFVLQHVFIAYADAYHIDDPEYDLGLVEGITGGFFMWLGFVLPLQFGQVTWEGKPWSLFFVNAAYYVLTLVGGGVIFAYMVY